MSATKISADVCTNTIAVPAMAPTLQGSTLDDFASAAISSCDALASSVRNAVDLLHLTGFAGTPGDTAADLITALAQHTQLLRQLRIKASTYATNHAGIASAAAKAPTPVTAEPDRAALNCAHKELRITAPLDTALKDDSLAVILRRVAMKHMRRPPAHDLKRLAANDLD